MLLYIISTLSIMMKNMPQTTTMIPSPLPQLTYPQIYQLGQGIIRRDGSIYQFILFNSHSYNISENSRNDIYFS